MDWHAQDPEIVLKDLKSSLKGLSQREAHDRLKRYGHNTLKTKTAVNPLIIFVRQIHNPLIYILLVSAFLAFFIGKYTDSLVVFGVVLLNTVIGFLQEYKSGRSIQALMKLIPQSTQVMRDQILTSLSSHLLVPGDVVVLQAGDRVAADIRLFSVKNLSCDESSLTGESLPVSKRVEPVSADAPLAERKCMAYNGTLVSSGNATGIVVATGLQTEFGKISEMLETITPLETPLTRTLKKVANIITAAVFVAGVALFFIGYFRGHSILDAAIASIALAVAAIPEGLPATITIAAAIGVERMAKRKAIIRHLPAVETLGSTSVICTDKTGTLTKNEMTVQEIWTPKQPYFVSGIGYAPEGTISPQDTADLEELFKAITLCNDAVIVKKEHHWVTSGDPTELALIVAARKGGFDENEIRNKFPRSDVIPFESERRIMATLHSSTIYIKGSPEKVAAICAHPPSALTQEIENMAKQGIRVIAAAKKVLPHSKTHLEEQEITSGFEFLGICGMIDPPREGVAEAIEACQEAGIVVKMITGDHPLTATVIGSELGLEQNRGVITGEELHRLSSEKLAPLIQEKHIFARALPEQKLKIVQALQVKKYVVAMTGDGVNDAPALKQADIGVGMGISGTAVAKEAADMVLADDNFTSIKAAVEEGRRVYDNLIKSIAFIFPTSLAQALVILLAILFFPIEKNVLLLPILPVQILWINLVVAVALALPLAFEVMEPDIMKRPPRRPDAPLFSPFILARTFFVGTLMALGAIALFFWEYFHEIDNALAEAQTMSVTAFMFFQVFYLLNCRSFSFSPIKIGLFSNPYILIGIATVIVAQIAFVHLPFMNTLFRSAPLSPESWLLSLFIASLIFPLLALEKWLINYFYE